MALQNNVRNSSLLGNIAGNLVRAGQHRPLVSPQSAVLKNQEVNLHNNLMKSQSDRIKAETAAEELRQAREVALKPQVDAILNAGLPIDQTYAALGKIGAKTAQKAYRTEIEFKQAQADRNKPKDPAKVSPYFTAKPTTGGYITFNNRTGTAEPLLIDGVPAVRSADSPELQAEIAGSKEIGKAKGADDQKLYERVSVAPLKLERINKELELLNSSDTITGLGAESLEQVERAKVLLGGNSDKLKDTQLLKIMLGADVFAMMQDMGLTSKQMDTPAEREYMRMVLAGTIPLNKDVLIEMNSIKKRAIQAGLDKWNGKVERGELDRWEKATGVKAVKYGVPPEKVASETGVASPELGDVVRPLPLGHPGADATDAEIDAWYDKQ